MNAEIKTIAVIGADLTGRQFARAALLAGYRTILEDVAPNRLEQAITWIKNLSADSCSRLLTASTVEEALREADLIVEAVAEEMEMKIEMFTIFDKFAKSNAIFASSSSSLSIADMASVTFCPERCIGMRFSHSAGGKNILELVRAPQTSQETVAACREVGRRMGKEVVIASELPTSRKSAAAQE